MNISELLSKGFSMDSVKPILTKYMRKEKVKTYVVRFIGNDEDNSKDDVDIKQYTKDFNEFISEMKGHSEALQYQINTITKDAEEKITEQSLEIIELKRQLDEAQKAYEELLNGN